MEEWYKSSMVIYKPNRRQSLSRALFSVPNPCPTLGTLSYSETLPNLLEFSSPRPLPLTASGIT